MIPCAENCVYQKEGCCTLKGKTVVTNSVNSCPYLKENASLTNKVKGFSDCTHINKLN